MTACELLEPLFHGVIPKHKESQTVFRSPSATRSFQQEWTTDHREWYRNVYLQSDHWRELRGRKLKVNPGCERCPAKASDVHHVRYRNIFDVEIGDLLSLCRACHKKEHEEHGMPRREKVSFKGYFPPAVRAAMIQQRQRTKRILPKRACDMNPEELKALRKLQAKKRHKFCPYRRRDQGPRIR